MPTVPKQSVPELWLHKAASDLGFTAAVCGVCLDTLESWGSQNIYNIYHPSFMK